MTNFIFIQLSFYCRSYFAIHIFHNIFYNRARGCVVMEIFSTYTQRQGLAPNFTRTDNQTRSSPYNIIHIIENITISTA